LRRVVRVRFDDLCVGWLQIFSSWGLDFDDGFCERAGRAAAAVERRLSIDLGCVAVHVAVVVVMVMVMGMGMEMEMTGGRDAGKS
jgi:hypothetical protein